MYVVDMHCDSLLTVSEDRGLISSYNFSNKYPHLQFVAEFCMRGNEDAYTRRRRLLRMLDIYLYECQRLGLEKIKSVRDLNSVVEAGKSAALLSVEGGGGLFENSDELTTLRASGLLVLGMAWDDNELTSSAWTECDTGLTEEGKRLCERALELGIILDVSHLSDKAFYDTLEYYPAPVLATHSNFRDVCKSKRNLTRDMAKMIAERGGVIGINIYPPFLSDKDTATLDDIYRHVEYGLEAVGENHLGFGFDIDGTSGKYPLGINTEESIHEQVIDFLLSKYPQKTVEKIAGENVIEFLQNNIMF